VIRAWLRGAAHAARRLRVVALDRVAPRAGALARMGGALDAVLPPDLERLAWDEWVPSRQLGHVGFELDEVAQLERLRGWTRLGAVFHALRTDPRINTTRFGEPSIHNGQYATPDPEVYAGMLADHEPATVLEIGAGFSTLIARRTIEELGLGTRIHVIDPEPRTDVADVADRLLRRRIEDVPVADLPLEPGSFLFVDSSHVTRALGDVPHLFNVVIPALPAGVVVHVHDVFTPFDYPGAYRARLYSEQYVLQALLAGAAGRFHTLFATHWMTRAHLGEMRAVFGDGVAADDGLYGASYWFVTR
jgi:hypothetical protein